jgi:hypothetical protein
MHSTLNARVDHLHRKLIRVAQTWAWGRPYSDDEAAALRREALLLNHEHYLETIPAYARLARDAGVGKVDELGPIQAELLSTDDVFKSYDPTWLDEGRFNEMNRWLGSVFHERIDFDASNIKDLDGWFSALMAHGVRPIYSSGSSGRFSFVPRDPLTWHRFSTAPSCYIAPLFLRLGLASTWQQLLMRPAMGLLDPFTFAGLLRRRALPDFDGVFLAFRGGHMGTQIVLQEFAQRFAANTFLYDFDLSAATLRILARGPRTPEEDRRVLDFRRATVGEKEAAYARVLDGLRHSVRRGQKVFLAGAPYLVKELLDLLATGPGRLPLPPGSVVMTGGGWKTFAGEKIEPAPFCERIAETFAIPVRHVIDGYSMAEIHGVVPRCEHGRYHLPPLLECLVVDEELRPIPGKDVTGTFAFMDPFAVCYPGFIISGDRVRMVEGECACGTHGKAFTEIGRAAGREVKGCGGVMAQIQA